MCHLINRNNIRKCFIIYKIWLKFQFFFYSHYICCSIFSEMASWSEHLFHSKGNNRYLSKENSIMSRYCIPKQIDILDARYLLKLYQILYYLILSPLVLVFNILTFFLLPFLFMILRLYYLLLYNLLSTFINHRDIFTRVVL